MIVFVFCFFYLFNSSGTYIHQTNNITIKQNTVPERRVERPKGPVRVNPPAIKHVTGIVIFLCQKCYRNSQLLFKTSIMIEKRKISDSTKVIVKMYNKTKI